MTRFSRRVVFAGFIAPAVIRGQAVEVRFDAPSPIAMAAISRSGEMVAGVSADRLLRVWDVKSRRVTNTLDTKGRVPAWLGMSNDGKRLLMGDYSRRVTIWSAGTTRVDWDFTLRHYIIASAFSPDDRLLAIVPGSPVELYDVTTRRRIRQFDTTVGTSTIAFSPDGTLLASCDGDAVRIYDARSGRLLSKNTESVAEPLAVAFSADGRYVLAGGGDRRVLAIDARSGTTVGRSAAMSDPIMYLAVSPDGHQLAIVTQNADDPARPAPVVLAALPGLAFTTTWPAPTGVLLPGAGWDTDGHFRVVTQTGTVLHLWTVR